MVFGIYFGITFIHNATRFIRNIVAVKHYFSRVDIMFPLLFVVFPIGKAITAIVSVRIPGNIKIVAVNFCIGTILGGCVAVSKGIATGNGIAAVKIRSVIGNYKTAL